MKKPTVEPPPDAANGGPAGATLAVGGGGAGEHDLDDDEHHDYELQVFCARTDASLISYPDFKFVVCYPEVQPFNFVVFVKFRWTHVPQFVHLLRAFERLRDDINHDVKRLSKSLAAERDRYGALRDIILPGWRQDKRHGKSKSAAKKAKAID